MSSEDVYHAIADPTRRRILDLLARSERPVRDIAAPFEMSRPAVSQHLRILREAGLVSERRVGRQRIYRLRAEPLREVEEWVRGYRRFWADRMRALGEYLDQQQEDQGKSQPGAPGLWDPCAWLTQPEQKGEDR
ncbi:ArsR/SmtB family transcription factor [Longimycelium tulufanense]|uniref:ArsR/SmtB family transcription factor n=1 Tax=Longimycelium tulufanense TaxID=907463 RepID=UPI001666EC4C|nr:metalloregulator ArsR/SmtB family transcription factor [Longimycelium tulufanense]